MPYLRQSARRAAPRTEPEEGFILLAVLFLVVLILIALAVAAPAMARSIQRDKELELVHRGEQYKRAIKLYYKKFGAYPSSIDQLVNTNNIRFLRRRYTDPITGKDDWRIIHLGQAKVPPMGLFGQPLMIPGMPGQVGTATTMGGNPTAIPAAGSSGTSSSSDSSTFGTATPDTPDTSNSPDSGDDSGSTSVESAANNPSVTITGSGPAQQPSTTTQTGTTGTGSSAFGSSASGSTNPTFGGGPIVGVGIPNPKPSLIEYKKQKKYNQWEFVYNPLEEQLQGAALLGGGTQNPNGTGTGTGTGIGQTGGSGGTGQTSGSSDTGSGGTTPSPTSSNPQQQ
jgi:type II secretory pathway pseudopilin PulG